MNKRAILALIHQTAAEYDCELSFTLASWRGSRVDFPFGDASVTAVLPTPNNVEEAITALHELGHVATRYCVETNDVWWDHGAGRERLEWEAWAWEWALDNYPGPITRRVWAFIHYALNTYASHTFADPGPAFRRLLATAKIESGGEMFTP